MPRRNKNVEPKRRQPYRPDMSLELQRIERKRLQLGVTVDELVSRAGLTDRTLRNMKRSGLAWPRHVRALTYALRTIQNERRIEEKVLK